MLYMGGLFEIRLTMLIAIIPIRFSVPDLWQVVPVEFCFSGLTLMVVILDFKFSAR